MANFWLKYDFSAGHGGGGGGGGTYTGASPTTITVGGLPSGSAIAGLTYTQLFQDILVPYINPSFSSFNIVGQSTSIEVGSTLSGTVNFGFSFNNIGNVVPNSLEIYDITGATALLTGAPLTSPQSANIGSITETSPSSYSWRGMATNTEATVFDSSPFTVNWEFYLFEGTQTLAVLAASDIQALSNSQLGNSFAQTFAFVAGGYKYFCWPDSFGSPTATVGFKDTSNNLPVAMATVIDNAAYSNVQNGWYYDLVSVTNGFAVTENYRIYRSQNQLGGTITIQVS